MKQFKMTNGIARIFTESDMRFLFTVDTRKGFKGTFENWLNNEINHNRIKAL